MLRADIQEMLHTIEIETRMTRGATGRSALRSEVMDAMASVPRPHEDYGMISTPDSPESSFHRNSVQNADIDALVVGTLVTFNEVEGLCGGQGDCGYMASGRMRSCQR